MSQLLTQPSLLTTLAYLMGERGVNTSTTAPRADFLQKTLEEAYHAYPWRFSRRTITIAPVLSTNNYIYTLPTAYDPEMESHAHYFSGTDQIDLNEISDIDKGSYYNGDLKYWITSPADGTWLFNTKETQTSYSFRYQEVPPTLDSVGVTGTSYPSGMTLAYGARRYVKLGQNPDADISQDEKLFQLKLANDIATERLGKPAKKRRQLANRTGDF